ncbi:MAG: 1-deoxy-D-xylulose-5-phosphate synthase [Planctomycetaceae bacterium]|nr:1-deoxy-D-xylulose-5-phosphate synthase [Planctomycetaceae bacterium]
MEYELLPLISSPQDLRTLNDEQLEKLASEIREALCQIVETKPAHFASNLGVVELCLALHLVFDFSRDRLLWDTGHQIYPHKLITGRFPQFLSIRDRGGLMGFPNPRESPYDLFMTGHAGSSVSTVLGMKTADDLLGESDRKSVAVIGDGALPSGVVFEAFNNAAGLNKDLLVILNDNKMGICPRVGGLAEYLDKARVAPFYNGLKRDVAWVLNKLPMVGDSTVKGISTFKDAVKTLLHGGMLFEQLGFRYIGPIDGHDLRSLRKHLEMVKDIKGPTLLHVFTDKGKGFQPACEDPVKFHSPSPFERTPEGFAIPRVQGKSVSYTEIASETIYRQMKQDEKVVVLTAAMCAGNNLEKVRDELPDRFFDTGICEAHAVAFAAGMAKSGMKPIVDIYSTFLQRSFDHIFQEVALQNLPVTFCMDRAGLCGPDGPTHHGVFDNTYMRAFPNITVMAPGDSQDLEAMIPFAVNHDGPVSIRYPKTTAEVVPRDTSFAPIEYGKSEVISWGNDVAIVCFGGLLSECLKAADKLSKDGIDIGLINARFLRPLDTDVILKAIRSCEVVITVEENTLCGGFGSTVLECANDAGLSTQNVRRLGIPDRFIEHGDRATLLAELGLNASGFIRVVREMLEWQSSDSPVAS